MTSSQLLFQLILLKINNHLQIPIERFWDRGGGKWTEAKLYILTNVFHFSAIKRTLHIRRWFHWPSPSGRNDWWRYSLEPQAWFDFWNGIWRSQLWFIFEREFPPLFRVCFDWECTTVYFVPWSLERLTWPGLAFMNYNCAYILTTYEHDWHDGDCHLSFWSDDTQKNICRRMVLTIL